MAASSKTKSENENFYIQTYLKEGERRAMNLGNRGPIQFDDDGQLSAEIQNAYSDIGFYVFENVIEKEELKDLEKDLQKILDNLPEKRGLN